MIYEIIILLLRTLRFPEIKTCDPTEELGGDACDLSLPFSIVTTASPPPIVF
jgi:hypothetical protein